jgi:hypothetical protein
MQSYPSTAPGHPTAEEINELMAFAVRIRYQSSFERATSTIVLTSGAAADCLSRLE